MKREAKENTHNEPKCSRWVCGLATRCEVIELVLMWRLGLILTLKLKFKLGEWVPRRPGATTG